MTDGRRKPEMTAWLVDVGELVQRGAENLAGFPTSAVPFMTPRYR